MSNPRCCDPQASAAAGTNATHDHRRRARVARCIDHHQLVAQAHVGIDAPDFVMHTQPSSFPASVVNVQTGFVPASESAQGVVQGAPFTAPDGHAGGDDDGV